MLRSKHSTRRPAAAAAEFAICLTFVLVPMLLGIWEVGRMIQVQQVISNAAREGARLAAQARTINSVGNPTEILASIDPPNTAAMPNVKATVMQSLFAAGLTNLTWNDVDVTFEFLDQPPGAIVGTGPGTHPVQGVKNQRFRVVVVLNDFSKVRWISIGLINPTQLRESVEWRSLVDDPFVINPDMPSW